MTKYVHQRLDRQRLIFNSVVAGSFLTLISYYIKDYFFTVSQIDSIKEYIPEIIADSGWNTIFLTLPLGIALGLVSWLILSIQIPVLFPKHPLFRYAWIKFRPIFTEERWIKYAVKKIGNEFDQLYLKAIKNKWVLEVTLSGGKVYVGKVLAIPKPGEVSQLRLLPVMSGYRDKETKTLHFTTFYDKLYKYYKGQGIEEHTLNMDLIIDRKEIISANRFDFQIYIQFGIQNAHPVKRNQSS